MAHIQDRETFGRARLTFADEADIDSFVTMLTRFENGDAGPDEWRAFRLLRGTYGQRQDADAHMMRVKIPQGILDRAQLEALARVGEKYSRGFGHITTRQNIQFHFVKLHDAELAMRELAEAGVTTREACGNSVRNITACPYAGVAADEPFDVTPYAEALTRYLLRHPLSSVLPRKFKIAFEGCAHDHIGAAINDIGWTARIQKTDTSDGRPVHGFRVNVAGGTATMTRAGNLLHEFLPADEMFDCAEAIIRVFHRLGDYKHKQKNRLKFLVRSLGWDGFKAEYETERAALEALDHDARPALPFDRDAPPTEGAPPPSANDPLTVAEIATRATSSTVIGPGIVPQVAPRLLVHTEEFLDWSSTNVRPQKQKGFVIVVVTTLLGDLTSAQFRLLGDLAGSYGDGTIRVTSDQNLVFRWVRAENVEPLYRSLAAAGLVRPGAGTLSDVTSCPGAESCKLAVTQSRGLGRVLADHLQERRDLVDALPGLDIKISGCPNGCGQHHIAGIGFQGSIKKVGDRPVPQYFVMVGGGFGDGTTTFGRLAAKVPARRIVEALERLVKLYQDQRTDGESPIGFFRRVDVAAVKATLADLERMTPEEAGEEDFIDLAEVSAFNPQVMDGECSA
jgi:sulfite reductase beta subunit-like hemoprotein